MYYTHAKLSKMGMQALMSLQPASLNHKPTFAIGVAYALSSRLPLTTQETTDVRELFRTQHDAEVSTILSQLNEFLPFDMKSAREKVMAFFSYRLAQLYPPKFVPAFDNGQCGVRLFFGLQNSFGTDTLDLLEKESLEISNIVTKIQVIIDDVTKKETVTMDNNLPSDGLIDAIS